MIGALIFEAFKSAALGYVVAFVSTPKTKGKSAQEYSKDWTGMAATQQANQQQQSQPKKKF